jgi:hypothetical protein
MWRVLLLAAVGMSGGAPAMLGEWSYATGKTTRTCPGQPATDAPPEGGMSIAPGARGEVVVTEACPLRFELAGRVATIVGGQTCAGPDGAGGQIRFEKMIWKLSLSADGKTLTEELAADEIYLPASGPSRTCRYIETGVTLRRR